MKFSKKDLISAIITGFITGLIIWQVMIFLGNNSLLGYPFYWLMVIVPIIWILGINLGYFLGRWLNFFNQFGKFAALGFTNFAVDLGVLNMLIFWTEIEAGFWYSVFKTVSFTAGSLHSYFWNKYWVFNDMRSNPRGEIVKFFSVSILGMIINVAIASVIVSIIGPQFGVSAEAWASVGGIAGSAVALIFNFVGYKKTVFHQDHESNSVQKI